jgi:hypothetical protein
MRCKSSNIGINIHDADIDIEDMPVEERGSRKQAMRTMRLCLIIGEHQEESGDHITRVNNAFIHRDTSTNCHRWTNKPAMYTHMMNTILIESAILLGLRCVLHVCPLAWLTYDIDIDEDVPCSSHVANFYYAASTWTCRPFRRPPPPHSLLLHQPTPRMDFLTLYSRVRSLRCRSLRVALCSCC